MMNERKIRVALVAPLPTAGGLSRFLEALATHLVDAAPDIAFTAFINSQVASRDSLDVALAAAGIELRLVSGSAASTTPLAEEAPKQRGAIWKTARWVATRNRYVYSKSLAAFIRCRKLLSGQREWYDFAFSDAEVEQLGEFDVVYFVNPFFMAPFKIDTPLVATMHDLNFKHFWRNYTPDMLALVERQTAFWTRRLDRIITSTEFIRDEVNSAYPVTEKKTDVIYLAPYSMGRRPQDDAEAIVAGMGIPSRFVFYPSGSGEHKNIGTLLKAMDVLKKQGCDVPLVVTGVRVPLIAQELTLSHRDSLSPAQSDFRQTSLIPGKDVFFLSYISNEEVDALSTRAQIVLSTSLYEAGCGPAMDAWQQGVPVAFSNIPPYREQLRVQGTRAWLFDPKDPDDIASTILSALSDVNQTREMVEQSRHFFGRYTWKQVAEAYADVFRSAAKAGHKLSLG